MPEPTHDINKMVMGMNKIVMYINEMMELYDDTSIMVMTLITLLCLQCLYVVFLLVQQSVWFSYYSATSHPYTAITIFAFVCPVSVY